MRNVLMLSLLLPFLLLAEGPVEIHPEKPVPGSKISILYNPTAKDAAIVNSENISLYALFWPDGDELYFQEYEMEKRESKWKTTIVLSGKTEVKYVTLKFVSGEKEDDRGGKMWDIRFFTDDGTLHPGTYYQKGLSYLHRPGLGAMYSGAEMFREVNREKGEKIFSEAYELYPDDPDIARIVIQHKARKIDESDNPDSFKSELISTATKLEEQYPDNPSVIAAIANMYLHLGDEEKHQKYRQRVIDEFPRHRKSETFRERDIFDRDVDASVLIERAKAFLKDFPESERKRGAILRLVLFLPELNEFEEAYRYLTSYEEADPELYFHFASSLSRNEGDPELILDALSTALELIDNPPAVEKPPYVTEREWTKRFETERWLSTKRWITDDSHNLAASAYLDLGKIEEALSAITKAYENSDGNNTAINTRYVEILKLAGKSEKAIEAGRNAIIKNKAGDHLIEHLKEAFIDTYGSDEGFPDFIEETRNESIQMLRTKFAERMREEPAPVFTLPQLGGDPVSLADLEEKVVILDFWATWCGPCIAAFPHFQKVVDYYTDNPDVVFLAINTREGDLDEQRIDRVRKFIEENEYTFPVLLDEDTVVEEYGVRGIPTRIAIGRDGKIRFVDVGFSGPGMYHEMIVQIDMLLDDLMSLK